MNQDNIEKLIRKWPALFEKSRHSEFSVGDGWYDVIDVLCGFLSSKVESASRQLKYKLDNVDYVRGPTIPELRAKLAEETENLCTIAQVKEKFGTLRFYVDGASDEIYNYISFAEAMTSRICEVCGSPGHSRTGSWVRVLCDTHAREIEEETERRYETLRGKISVKLSDED